VARIPPFAEMKLECSDVIGYLLSKIRPPLIRNDPARDLTESFGNYIFGRLNQANSPADHHRRFTILRIAH
jgi:hypothetical protein